MILFNSDYMEGAHPQIIERLIAVNFDKNEGYCHDDYCKSATEKIKIACKQPNAEVKYLVGGTQTNAMVIDAILRHSEGVVAAESGHILTHEAGAIESWGHKIIGLPYSFGKLEAKTVDKYIENFYIDDAYEHMVLPKMVYITHPTEFGTLYTLDELKALRQVCDKYNIPLYLDGARLGYGLAAEETDVTLPDIAELCDVFYIGGTKVGALFGEAIVITNPNIKITMGAVKSHGALLAKGWLLGMQFDTLFTDNLYLKISKNAITQAMKLKKALTDRNYKLLFDSHTNQQFVIISNKQFNELKKDIGCSYWGKFDDDNSIVRFVTSWATTDQQIAELISYL